MENIYEYFRDNPILIIVISVITVIIIIIVILLIYSSPNMDGKFITSGCDPWTPGVICTYSGEKPTCEDYKRCLKEKSLSMCGGEKWFEYCGPTGTTGQPENWNDDSW